MTNSRTEVIRHHLLESGRDVRPAIEALNEIEKELRRMRYIEEAAQAYVDQPDPDKIQDLLDSLDAEQLT